MKNKLNYDLDYAIDLRGKTLGDILGPENCGPTPGNEAALVTFWDSINIADLGNGPQWSMPLWAEVMGHKLGYDWKKRSLEPGLNARQEWKKQYRGYREYFNQAGEPFTQNR